MSLEHVAQGLLWLASFGLAALLLQGLVVLWQVHRPQPPPRTSKGRRPPISILKPLCGVDEDLEANLACFVGFDYPFYELLLGVRDEQDPAWEVAMRASRRWPTRVRVVLQQGAPGLNPKVNQLVTLARSARHEILVVSDSNARVAPDYLDEIAACFEAPEVACVTHPVVGSGEQSLGALMDNLHLSSSVGAGQIASKCLANRDLVVGKSMALRRRDLEALGGFEAFANHLAEDYVMGQAVTRVLGRKVVVARGVVHNVARTRSTVDFFKRYIRWSIIHRTAIKRSTYLMQALLNPAPLAWIALLLSPTPEVLAAAGAITVGKAVVDVWTASALRGSFFGMRALWATPIKDALLFSAWVNGLFVRTVNWRGSRLRVSAGSRLVPSQSPEIEVTARAA